MSILRETGLGAEVCGLPAHTRQVLLTRIRVLLVLFMIGLVLSGLTAFWLEWEVRLLARFLGVDEGSPPQGSGLAHWIATVRDGLIATNARYPFLAYGTDWLAFAHLVIAVAFIGPLRDPERNEWVITFGLIACASVIPLALIAGAIRGIPFYWRLIDCSFGVLGFIPLWLCRRYIQMLAADTIQRECAQRLAQLGGSESQLQPAPRRHSKDGTGGALPPKGGMA